MTPMAVHGRSIGFACEQHDGIGSTECGWSVYLAQLAGVVGVEAVNVLLGPNEIDNRRR